ncbi:MAG TPA: hypothetical protein VGO70_05170 [Arsenicitalea sp.]|nr:hypothetical protein [Arsenicitalea sp.]
MTQLIHIRLATHPEVPWLAILVNWNGASRTDVPRRAVCRGDRGLCSERYRRACLPWQRSAAGLLPPIFALLLAVGASGAERPTIWSLQLGTTALDLPSPAEFGIFGWGAFRNCPADQTGLHEVYFEYDDEAAFVARAHNDPVAARGGGTEESAFPVITSALFDDAGIVRKLRLVTDARPLARHDAFAANLRPREEHYLLGPYLYQRFGIVAGRDCHNLPPAPGETPVFGLFVKLDCLRIDAPEGRSYRIEQRYLRKPGQTDFDAETGFYTQDEYESQTRVEIADLTAAANKDRP